MLHCTSSGPAIDGSPGAPTSTRSAGRVPGGVPGVVVDRCTAVIVALAVAFGLMIGVTGCGGASPDDLSAPGAADDPTGAPLTVVTTTAMIADVVRNIAGPHADVRALMGEGIDPHTYRPTRGDVVAVSGADVVLINGLHLEGRMGEVLEGLGDRVVPVAERIDVDRRLADGEDSATGQPGTPAPADAIGGTTGFDPHLWMDVSLWSAVSEVIEAELVARRPAAAADIAARATAYRAELAELDAYVAQAIGSIPESARILVTAHDAFGYFGRAYGIDVRGIQGLSTASEAGVRDINALVELLVSRRVPAVFVESSVSDRNVRAIVEGAGRRDHAVIVGGTLYSDAMGPADTWTGTYIGMIDHNASTIARSLGGDVPAGGFRERAAGGAASGAAAGVAP